MAALRAPLLPLVQAHPDATLNDYRRQFAEQHGIEVSRATLSRVIVHDLGWTVKKSRWPRPNGTRPSARPGGTGPPRSIRGAGSGWTRPGSHTGFTPTYSRAPRGARAPGSAPRNNGVNHTVVTARPPTGMLPGLTVDGGMTGQAFAVYVERGLAPRLRPGQIVVMDNLRAHFHPRVRALIEAQGAEMWHLPAYSPDFNPIEEAFSKVKAQLRRVQARTEETLRAATWAALRTITPRDAAGWFQHCGYGTMDQLL